MFAAVSAAPLVTGFLALFCSRANAMVPGDFPAFDPDPLAIGALGVHVENDQDMIPAFRAGSRDRFGAGVHGHWMAADRVLLDAHWSWLIDVHPDGQRQTGPGDLELGALLRLPVTEGLRAEARARGRQGPAFGLGWRVKLPNAADEGELGSDETDVALVAGAGLDLGPLRGRLGGGLAILGDPLGLAAQDDIVFLQAGLGWDAGAQLERSWLPRVDLGLDAALPSAANPTRVELSGGLAWGARWSVGLAAGAGLTAAAPTARVGIVVEHRFLAQPSR